MRILFKVKNRRISQIYDTEVVKCGSFPKDYNFYGTSVVYSVGMSVPPLMIARIADDLIKQIDFRGSRILKEIKVEDILHAHTF
jgi:site-specific DNA-cytosine methylase